jgi:hypothetical protein
MDLRVKHVFFQSHWSSNMSLEYLFHTLETFLPFTLFQLSSVDLHDIDILCKVALFFTRKKDDCFSYLTVIVRVK